jgi:fructokinase
MRIHRSVTSTITVANSKTSKPEDILKGIGCRIGIDLGGTKIEGIALGRDSNVLARQRVVTPNGKGDTTYRQILNSVCDLIRDIESSIGFKGSVGVGIPGTLSTTTRLVKNANSISLIGHPLDQDLEDLLQRPVRLQNDANCFAFSEATDGAATGVDSVFGVILGTGTGGGIVINGTLVDGVNGVGGEWGHNSLPWPRGNELPGPDCYCGKQGCIETFLSGPGLQMSYLRRTGLRITAEEISRRAYAGERHATVVLTSYEDRLARGLAGMINLLDPAVIVLGGGLSNIGRLYDNVPDLWTDYVFSDDVQTTLVKAHHGDSSGVRGAAWLWSESEIWG